MKQSFGRDRQGRQASLYTLENNSVIMKTTDHGATLVSLTDKKTGIDVVHGFSSCEEYENQDFYIGATIGRTANRIEKGIFHLNGKEYHIPVNNNGNANHGGINGFNRRMFTAEEGTDYTAFVYESPDGEEGYPGRMTLIVTYRLLSEGIAIHYHASSDADTLFAPTCHSYFNLDESEDAMNHRIRIHSDRYGLSDANGLTLDEIVPVEGTPFDFRSFKPAGQDINKPDEQLKYGAGYDHFYPVEGSSIRLMAEAEGKKLHLSMYSDLPGMHFYTSNWLDGIKGKKGHSYKRRSAVCFEAEFMPNAVNYPERQQPVLYKGRPADYEIQYLIGLK